MILNSSNHVYIIYTWFEELSIYILYRTKYRYIYIIYNYIDNDNYIECNI